MKSIVLVLTAALAFAASARAGTINYPDSPVPVTTPITTTSADPVTLSITAGSAIQSGKIDGDGSLTKIGAGKITLAELGGIDTNTYTGPTIVAAGTLIVDSVIESDVTVQSGATFGGDGTINGDITLQSGSTLLVVDCFDAETLTWNAGAAQVYSLGEFDNDILELSGALIKAGSGSYVFNFVNAGWQVGQTYRIATFDSTTFTASDLSYANGSGFAGVFTVNNGAVDQGAIDFTLTAAVPEPSTYAIGIAGLLGTIIFLRRRRRA